MKRKPLFLLTVFAASLGFGTIAQAQSDWQQREAQRRWRMEQREHQREQQREQERQREWERQQERQQRELERARRAPFAGVFVEPRERDHQTIDHRTQALPAAPGGTEWRRSESGDHILVDSSTGVIVQVVRNVTPQ